MQLVAIDWSGIRAASVAIGIRAAARRASEHLPPVEQNRFVKRVLKRAEREKWTNDWQLVRAQPNAEKPLSSPVVNGSLALINEIKDNEVETRVSLSRSCRHMASQAEKAELKSSGDVHKVAQTFAILHPPEQNKATLLNLSVLVGQSPVERAEQAKVIDLPNGED